MEPNTLFYVLNEFIIMYRKILQNYTPYRYNFYILIIKFQGLVARKPHLCIWLLGTFVNSSCDIKINIKIVKIAV